MKRLCRSSSKRCHFLSSPVNRRAADRRRSIVAGRSPTKTSARFHSRARFRAVTAASGTPLNLLSALAILRARAHLTTRRRRACARRAHNREATRPQSSQASRRKQRGRTRTLKAADVGVSRPPRSQPLSERANERFPFVFERATSTFLRPLAAREARARLISSRRGDFWPTFAERARISISARVAGGAAAACAAGGAAAARLRSSSPSCRWRAVSSSRSGCLDSSASWLQVLMAADHKKRITRAFKADQHHKNDPDRC